jgi:RHS repeat-associated protein
MAYASSHTDAQRRSPVILADATIEYESSLAAMWHALRAAKAAGKSDVESNSSVVQDYLNARYYNGSQGQFTSQDPVFLGDPKQQDLQDPQSLNAYSYSEDNPITKSDPNGKSSSLA